MKNHFQIVGESLSEISGLAFLFNTNEFAVTVSQAPSPSDYLLTPSPRRPEALIVSLTGSESIADVLSLHASYPESAIVFLARQFPPSAAAARVVARHGGVILRVTESPLVIAATMIMLLAQRRVAST
jgi:hypothetical protein